MINYTKYNLVNDLGFVKTGVDDYSNLKKYFSTGSIKENIFTPEGSYDYKLRPSRANREVFEGDVLQARMQNTNKIILVDKNLHGNLFSTGFFQFRPPKELVAPRYLYYFLSSDSFLKRKNKLCGGSTQKAINDKNLKKIDIFLPPLGEQQRIVAKLDAAFAEIDAAIDVAEKYKSDAQLLFKRKLEHHFHLGRDNWHTTTIGDELTLQRGFDITKKEQKEGNVPVISSGGIKSFHNVAMAKAPGVVIGRKGSLGTTYYTEKDYFPHDTTLWIKDFKQNEPKFCFFFFLSLDVKKLDSGAANPALNRNNVHPLKTFWADKKVQKEVCDEFDKISVQTVALTLLQENKIKQLLFLKSAILAQELQSEAA